MNQFKDSKLRISAGILALGIGVVSLTLGIFVIPQLFSPTQEAGEAMATDSEESGATSRAETVVINKDLKRLGENLSLTYHIDRMELSKCLGKYSPRTPSEGATFVVIYYSARNDGKRPVEESSWNGDGVQFFIRTADDTTFESDHRQSSFLALDLGLESNFQILQPGIEKRSVVVFEVPDSALQSKPELLITQRGFGFPLYRIGLSDGSILEDAFATSASTVPRDNPSEEQLDESTNDESSSERSNDE